MSAKEKPLARLRSEIDSLDDAIHDLIVKRAAVVEEVGRVKAAGGAPALRPGREAMVLRRLIARHSGKFPAAALVRIWRELMAASVGMQSEFTLAVCVPDGMAGFIQLTRAQFGTVGPLATYKSPGEVISAVASRRYTVGVVPAPSLEDTDPWWRMLVGNEGRLPQVIGRLPFTGMAGGSDELSGMALGFFDVEETGNDTTLIIVEAGDEVSRTAVTSAFADVDLEVLFMDSRAEGGGRLVLVEIAGYVPAEDPRLGKIAASGRIPAAAFHPIGAYPAPFAPSDLGIEK